MTLDLNHEIKDILNVNSCKNQNNLDKNFKEKIYNYNFNTEKGKKMIPNHPLKYGIPPFNTKELNKNQNYYYKSHNNLEQDNSNANNDIILKENNSNLIKKLFAISPNHRIEDRIIIQNNNININNNFNIKKKGIEIKIEKMTVKLKYFRELFFSPLKFDITGLILKISPIEPIITVITIAEATLTAPRANVEYLPATMVSQKPIRICAKFPPKIGRASLIKSKTMFL